MINFFNKLWLFRFGKMFKKFHLSCWNFGMKVWNEYVLNYQDIISFITSIGNIFFLNHLWNFLFHVFKNQGLTLLILYYYCLLFNSWISAFGTYFSSFTKFITFFYFLQTETYVIGFNYFYFFSLELKAVNVCWVPLWHIS